MKYKAAAIVMFSNDLVELFTQLLDRITADHEQPHLHTATFIGSRGATIVTILQPVLASLRVILEAVIEARDTEFQDMSVLPAPYVDNGVEVRIRRTVQSIRRPMSEDGTFEAKTRAIEDFDKALPILLEKKPDVIAITGDHSTPSRSGDTPT